jgi:hypothetical protein
MEEIMSLKLIKVILCITMLAHTSVTAHAEGMLDIYGLEGIKVARVDTQFEDERSGFVWLALAPYAAAGVVAVGAFVTSLIRNRPDPRIHPHPLWQPPARAIPAVIGRPPLSERIQMAERMEERERLFPASPVDRVINAAGAASAAVAAHENARQMMNENHTVAKRVGSGIRAVGAAAAAAAGAGLTGPELRRYAPGLSLVSGTAKTVIGAVDDMKHGHDAKQVAANCALDVACTTAGVLVTHFTEYESTNVKRAAKCVGLAVTAACLGAGHALP